MSDKTLYDILELSKSASPESIRAAYDRLSVKFDTLLEENRTNPDIKTRYIAVKEAFLTLSNPSKRAEYDKTISSHALITNVEIVEPFWTTTKFLLLVLFMSFASLLYYNWQEKQAEAQSEKEVAEAKANAAAEQAKAEAQEAQADLQQKLLEDRQRREQEAEFNGSAAQQQAQDRVNQFIVDREQLKNKMEQQQAEAQRKRQEAQGAATAQWQLLHDKAELCQKEYERYGHSISCN
jgi:colicin import membrane protein